MRRLEMGDGIPLDVIIAGHPPPNPSELLSGRRFKDLIADLATRYDHVVIDAAPLLPVADSIALSGAVDGVLLVVQSGWATTANVEESLERLGRVNAPLIGLVLNQANGVERSGYRNAGYGRYGGYGRHGSKNVDTYGTAYRKAGENGTSEAAVSAPGEGPFGAGPGPDPSAPTPARGIVASSE